MDRGTVFRRICEEREEQEKEWAGSHNSMYWIALLVEELGEVARAAVRFDHDEFIEEVVHLAAVAVAILETEG